MSNRLNNLQTVAQSIVDIYGMNVTRAQFSDYVAKTGDAAAWTVYRKASDAGRGLGDAEWDRVGSEGRARLDRQVSARSSIGATTRRGCDASDHQRR